MSEKRTILKALQDNGSSVLIKKLNPDVMVSSVQKAKQLVENGYNLEERTASFHTARATSLGTHYSYCFPETRKFYRPLLVNRAAANDLKLVVDEDFKQIFSGEKVHYDDNVFPYSLAYAGYQFGAFAGQLGDGRVTNLFELTDNNDVNQIFQLKGSGLTPFSRFADGKAVLRSSIREFIISENLYHIGIPSTRALQLTLLPQTRAQRMTYETCAVVCRFSPCWIRLGNFDLFTLRPNIPGLIKLSNYCIDTAFCGGKLFPTTNLNHFVNDYFLMTEDRKYTKTKLPSHEKAVHEINDLTKYDQFFRAVTIANAKCVAYWQAYGFMNGVLNTDNTSIMGLSMDYGPFSFLDKYQSTFTPNHDDYMRRYSFENQPSIIWWNLTRFAQSLSLLIGAGESKLEMVSKIDFKDISEELETHLVERANEMIHLCQNEYKFHFHMNYIELMSKRLGLIVKMPDTFESQNDIVEAAEKISEYRDQIIEPLLEILHDTQIDYNNFFVKLQNYGGPFQSLSESSIDGMDFDYLEIFFNDDKLKQLKNYYLTPSGDSNATKNETKMVQLIETVTKIRIWTESYCKVMNADTRDSIAKKVNPLFIARNWIFDEVIENLTSEQRNELNDIESDLNVNLLEKLFLMSSNPYDKSKWDGDLLQEKENDWVSLKHETSEDKCKFMKQGTCSS